MWFKVEKKPKTLEARGPIKEAEKLEVSAGTLKAEEGYYVVRDGKEEYPVEPDIFRETYDVLDDEDSSSSEYFDIRKKPITVQARGPLDEKEQIDTMEGTVTATEGDYVIKGINREKYPIQPDRFNDLYRLV